MEYLIFGLTWQQIQDAQQGKDFRKKINLNKTGDYGYDPVGNGTYKMVPSGDIVNSGERDRRLTK